MPHPGLEPVGLHHIEDAGGKLAGRLTRSNVVESRSTGGVDEGIQEPKRALTGSDQLIVQE